MAASDDIPTIESAAAGFAERFGRAPRWLTRAPGRVNLIGDHTDYNGGFVLPMAIDRQTVLAAAPAAPEAPDPARARWRVHSLALDATADIPLVDPLRPGEPAWADYLRGVVSGFRRRGVSVPALDAVVATDLPLGGGLSSSAALEVAAATLIEAATGERLEPVEKARLCRWAERRYAGVPCGLMDQLTAVLAEEGCALLIDCRSETARTIPLPDAGVAVLVCDTQVRHTLADGAYARRHDECEEAARRLGVASLRDATGERLASARGELGPVLYRRARHVVTENERTLAAVEALSAGDLGAMGALLYQSHASLRDDFEVSCPELDAVVELAREIGSEGGMLGARMTGGGFGGCALALVRADRLDAVADALANGYRARTGRTLTTFRARPARGAQVLDDARGTGP